MKKLFASLLLVSFLASVSMAQVFIGSRQAGMGGCGVASAVGLNAVAYNPAGLMKGPNAELLLSGGVASQGMDKIIASLGSATDPAQFMVNNYSTNLDAIGSASGILGVNFMHIGVSALLPTLNATLMKPANSMAGYFGLTAFPTLALTLGHSLKIPGIPIGSVDVGANIKSITGAYGNIIVSGNPTAITPVVTATQIFAQGSGSGFDLGARTNIDIPMVTDFSLGIALRNISQSITYNARTQEVTYTYTAPGTPPTITKGTETTLAQVTDNFPTVAAIGCAATVPVINLKLAADIESITSSTMFQQTQPADTVTHLGLEYPLFLNTLILRCGSASGKNVSVTTLGAKVNIPFLMLEFANIIDNFNSKNTSYVIDAGFAF